MDLPSDLRRLTLSQARDALRHKHISSVELTQAYLKAIEQHNNAVNAYITVTPDKALKQAQESDTRLQQGNGRSLEGLPLGIKDLFCTQGVRTTAASRILENFIPPYESTVTQRLWDAGGVMLGKTNLDEFAMGSSNLTSAFGPVHSPWRSTSAPDHPLVPGGSSGGSSAAVAGGLALAATGTDTGGSIRQPAAFTGTVGIKPTYGRCSRLGIVAFASSLDQAGPITRSVQDGAALLTVMAGYDPQDSTSLNVPTPNFESFIGQSIKGLKIGIPQECLSDDLDSVMTSLWDQGKAWLEDAGAQVIPVQVPHMNAGLAAYYVLAPAEASSNLARYDGVRYGIRTQQHTTNIQELYKKTRGEGFGAEVKRRILIGSYVLSHGYYDAYYLKAQKVRSLLIQGFQSAFEQVDLLLTPTTPAGAFPIDAPPADPVSMYLNDIFTVTVNLAGLPGISVPAGLSHQGLPLGLQLIGKPLDEGRLLAAAYCLEQAAGPLDLPFFDAS